ncbi:MAG: toll/interleukin-1 receptor domain-containing protein [Nitrospirota bacterium]
MATSDEIFISYSHDSVEHVQRVLNLSNRLRSEGVDCVLDQYEPSPPEGWPRWMDKKIRDSKYVVLVCTESYFRRVMDEEQEGKGLGVRWEGNLIYQHFYNSGTINQRFVPVVVEHEHRQFIPTPLQGVTYYALSDANGYDDLYLRLTDQPKVSKPKLGKLRPLPKRSVKTNPAMFLSMPIDVDLWNAAKWSATFFSHQEGKPPVLGLAFLDETAARKIFEGWHERYGDDDRYEELRISIVEGPVAGEDTGYTVQVGPDPDAAIRRFKDAGYAFDKDILMCISRINRMTPPPNSKNLSMFKTLYAEYKTYFLAPGVISEDGKQLKPIFDLGIFKGKIHFRHVSEIKDNDIDSVVLGTGRAERARTPFGRGK